MIRGWSLPLLTAAALTASVAAACGSGDDEPLPEVYTSAPAGRIAFVSDRDGDQEIYVMNADGSGETRLTDNSVIDSDPAWSPDGTKIAFQTFRAGHSDVWIMNADGSNSTPLTDDGALDGQPRWSPDGRSIAYYSFADTKRGLLWVTNVDGKNARPVLNPGAKRMDNCVGGFPGDWFPNGQSILFRGGGQKGFLQICSVKLDGSDLKLIFEKGGSNASFPSLSPNAKWIAFVLDTGGPTEIYVMTANGKHVKQLTADGGTDENPVWSPDGQWLAFSSNRGGSSHIYIMRPDGTDRRQITTGDHNDTMPDWSPVPTGTLLPEG